MSGLKLLVSRLFVYRSFFCESGYGKILRVWLIIKLVAFTD